MSSISTTSAANSINWLQNAASAITDGSSNWMDPSSGPDAVDQAANAFAAAEEQSVSSAGSLAVNAGISALQTELEGMSGAGQSVNFLA
jgi:hypothetical protein